MKHQVFLLNMLSIAEHFCTHIGPNSSASKVGREGRNLVILAKPWTEMVKFSSMAISIGNMFGGRRGQTTTFRASIRRAAGAVNSHYPAFQSFTRSDEVSIICRGLKQPYEACEGP